jgi:hypothetical protein
MGMKRSHLALIVLLALLRGQAVVAAGIQRVQLVRKSAQRQATLASSANDDEGNVRLLNYMDAQVSAGCWLAGDRSGSSTLHTRGATVCSCSCIGLVMLGRCSCVDVAYKSQIQAMHCAGVGRAAHYNSICCSANSQPHTSSSFLLDPFSLINGQNTVCARSCISYPALSSAAEAPTLAEASMLHYTCQHPTAACLSCSKASHRNT